MAPWSNRRGTALPLALLVTAVLSMVVAAAFTRTSSERRITANQQAQIDAFAVAQSGLERYMTTVTSMPSASLDTTITGLPGGTAVVSVRRLRDTTASNPAAIFLISSRGINSAARRYDNSAPPAERTVAQYAYWSRGSLDVDAAFTSLSGLGKNGKSGSFDGTDGCSRKPTLPGVAVPNGLYSGHTEPIDGVPEDTPKFLGTPDTNGTARNAVRIDWQGVLGGAITPHYVIPGASWPSTAQMAAWPTILVNDTNYSLNGGSTDGKGILIVTGNLTINGSWKHKGIILVGGTLTSNGNNTIEGAVITGLNIKRGIHVPETAVGNGNKTFRFHSCNVDSAVAGLSGLAPVPNAWMDNLPTW